MSVDVDALLSPSGPEGLRASVTTAWSPATAQQRPRPGGSLSVRSPGPRGSGNCNVEGHPRFPEFHGPRKSGPGSSQTRIRRFRGGPKTERRQAPCDAILSNVSVLHRGQMPYTVVTDGRNGRVPDASGKWSGCQRQSPKRLKMAPWRARSRLIGGGEPGSTIEAREGSRGLGAPQSA